LNFSLCIIFAEIITAQFKRLGFGHIHGGKVIHNIREPGVETIRLLDNSPSHVSYSFPGKAAQRIALLAAGGKNASRLDQTSG
jgi:hypothetical protein